MICPAISFSKHKRRQDEVNYFKQLTVENFQSHKKTVLNFAPAGQLTVVVGRSRSGKTALIRALRWLLYNVPRGVAVASGTNKNNADTNADEKSGYCRVGASFIRVTLLMESGHSVIRERTAATNRYKIIAPGATEPEIFEGFGDSVPLEVQEITGVRPIRINDMEVNLNLSEQLDSPFLGSKSVSAPARAKVLGKLAGTEEIDHAGKTLGTDMHRRKQDELRLAGVLKTLDGKIAEYGYLPGMKMRLDTADLLAAKAREQQAEMNKLAILKEKWHGLNVELNECRAVLVRWSGLASAEKALKDAELTLQRMLHMEQQRSRLVGLVLSVASCRKTMDSLRGLDQAARIAGEVKEAGDRRGTMVSGKGKISNLKCNMETAKGQIEKLQGLDQAAALPDVIANGLAKRQIISGLLKKYRELDEVRTWEQFNLRYYDGTDQAAEIIGKTEIHDIRKRELMKYARACYTQARLIEDNRTQAMALETQIATLEKTYQSELTALGACPLCGNILN